MVVALLAMVGGVSYGQTFNYIDESNILNAPGEPKWFYYGEEGNLGKAQATHELKQTIYIANGQSKILDLQTSKIQNYQRWYRYDKKETLPPGFGTSSNTTSNSVIDGSYTDKTLGYNASGGTRGYVNYNSINSTIAVDVSTTARQANNTEPKLSYRIVYDIKDAAEIADKLMHSDTENPLEFYDLIAPIGVNLLIGPKYKFTGNNSNYYTSSVTNNVTTYTATKLGTSYDNLNKFYWEKDNNQIYYTATAGTPGNNTVADHTVYNDHIFSIKASNVNVGDVENWYLKNKRGNCIAHYRITYVDKDEVGPKVKGWEYRNEDTLKELYKQLIVRNFDYEKYTPVDDTNDAYINYKAFDKHGLAWSECSYAFTSGSKPTWSEYSFITTRSVGMTWLYDRVYDRLYENTKGKEMGMMFYVDASEFQGVVSNLDISEACCPGTQLYISSWIRNGNSESASSGGKLGPNLNFEIVGIDSDGNEDVMATYTTGTMGVLDNDTENGNEWHQIFFSTTVPRKSYSKMNFRIINNQLGSQGNDFVIDDIDIYMMQPAVDAHLTAPMCGNSAVVTMEIDYEKMIDIVGLSESTQDVALPIGCTVVDRIIYERYLGGYDKKGNPVSNPTEAGALAEAKVKISTQASIAGSADYFYFMLRHGPGNNYFENAYTLEPTNLAVGSVLTIDEYFSEFDEEVGKITEKIFRKNSTDKKLFLQVQMIGTPEMPIAVARDYYVIFNTLSPDFINSNDYLKYSDIANKDEHYYFNPIRDPNYADNLATLTNGNNYKTQGKCDVFAEYSLVGTMSVEIDGTPSLFYGGTEMCANSRPTFAIRSLSYIIDGKEQVINTEELGLYLDWYKGTVFDFEKRKYLLTDINSDTYDVTPRDGVTYVDSISVKQALNAFRNLYHTAEMIDGHDIQHAVDSIGSNYVAAMRTLLIELTTDAEHLNTGFEDDNTLRLHSREYTPLIGDVNTENDFLVIPIAKSINNNKLVGEGNNQKPISTVICLDSQFISVTSSEIAPSMSVGETNVAYTMSVVPVRVGLKHIKELSFEKTEKDETASTPYLRIPIRIAEFSHEDFDNIKDVINSSEYYRRVQLYQTNDPYVNDNGLVNTIVGYIQMINVEKTEDEKNSNSTTSTNPNNNVAIFFYHDENGNLPIEFREGYTYKLKFFISEFAKDGTKSNTCEGNVFIHLKIVPEYQVWSPQPGNRNWNNDKNWRRAEADEFYRTDGYISNNLNYWNADDSERESFVPIFNTKVIVNPSNISPSLHLADLSIDHRGVLDMTSDNLIIKEATKDIEFEMTIRNKVPATSTEPFYYPCSSFYANTCEEIYFKEGAAMMNPHHLKYDIARVELGINKERWYLMGSPLYGVVAGDMYTLKSGVQDTDAFKDIIYSITDNNRFAPAVYQRGWDKVMATVYDFNGGNNDAMQTDRNVAIKAAWSSVYNEVLVPYVPGVGFSVKSVPSDINQLRTNIRLPKADTEYNYYTSSDSAQSDAEDLAVMGSLRNDNGRLASDALTKEKGILSVSLSDNNIGNSDAANKLYLLANPFMSHLNMQEFFNVNSMFIPAYWLMTADKQVGVIMNGSTDASATDAATSIAPMQGFFVQLADGEKANPTVIYTAAMMTNPLGSTNALTRTANGISQLYITTTRDGISGTATLRVANEEANEEELLNLPTLLDSNWDAYPMVYTIGNGQAMQIQTVKAITTIPLGIYSNSIEEVEVRFDGVETFEGLTLYDALLDETTDIEEGMTLTLPGNTNGRYLLTFASAIEDDLMESITISAVERGQIWVTSDFNDPIEEVIVVDPNGRVCKYATGVNTNSTTIYIESGVYVVRVKTANASKTGKLFVRN